MAGFFLLAVQRTPLSEGSEAAPLFFVEENNEASRAAITRPYLYTIDQSGERFRD
jgi:hypothetical protein